MADPKASHWSLGRPAKDVYDERAKTRQGVLDKARELAAVVIPKLMPPDGYKQGDRLAPPNQSVNSWLVNNLASKIMFVGFPPNKPNLKFNVLEHKLQAQIDQDPELWSEINLALSRKEETHRLRLESTSLRSAYTWAMKLLLAGGGNCLWQHNKLDRPVVHRMDKYVVCRNSLGEVRFVVLKERVKFMDLKGPDRQLVRIVQKQKGITPNTTNVYEEEVDIYTIQKLDGDGDDAVWLYWQEYEGTMIPDSDVEAPLDVPPLYAAWLIPSYGDDWGGSYAEEYEGDMFTVENHSGSLNDGAEAAALLMLFLRPGSATSKRSVEEAENGKLLSGTAEDLTAFRLDKGADFQFVSSNLESAIQRLSRAWLAMSSIQRQAERVTAEEIDRLATDLDQAMGGLYSELAQGFQRHVVKRFIQLHQEDDDALPDLPEGIVSASVITGIDALGRSTELDNLVTAARIAKEAFGDAIAAEINPGDYMRRVLASLGVKPDGLVKSRDQKTQEAAQMKQDGIQQTLLEETAAPIAKAGAEGLSQAVLSQLPQPPQQ